VSQEENYWQQSHFCNTFVVTFLGTFHNKSNQEAHTVADKLVDGVFMRFGVPSQLHSDQGPELTDVRSVHLIRYPEEQDHTISSAIRWYGGAIQQDIIGNASHPLQR